MSGANRSLNRLLSEKWGSSGYSGTSFENLWHRELSRVFGPNFLAKSNGLTAELFSQVQWNENIMTGNGKTSGGVDFDGLLSLSGSLSCMDLDGNPIESILNFEYTVQTSQTPMNYWLDNTDPKNPANGKLIKLLKVLKKDAIGRTIEERMQDLKNIGKYVKLQVPKKLDRAYLIGLDRFGTNRPSDWLIEIQQYVKSFDVSNYAKYKFDTDNSGAVIITTPDGHKVVFQLLDLGEMADLMATIEAIGGTAYDSSMQLNQKNTTLVNNGMNHFAYSRIVAELTKTASPNHILLTESPNIMIPLKSVHAEIDPSTSLYNPKLSMMGGHNVETYRFEIDAEQLIMLTQVIRTVSKTGALQRIPDKGHMNSIAVDLGKKMFVNPIVTSTNQLLRIKRDSGNNFLEIDGTKPVVPFSWDLIDGQHRVYANYYVPPGTNASFEVVLYRYSSSINDELKDKINSQIFYDLNYRTKPADPEIALVRSAYTDSWTGDWDSYDPISLNVVFSRRVLASRFLIELSELDGLMKGIFNFRGLKSDESISLKSISTYFKDNFSFEARGRKTPGGHERKSILKIYDTLGVKSKGVNVGFAPNNEYPKAGVGAPIGPSPEKMENTYFWKESTKDFNNFLNALENNTNIKNGLLRTWTLKNTCIMPGIWQFYIAYCTSNVEIPTRNGGKWDSTIVDTICKFFTTLDAQSLILGNKKSNPPIDKKYGSGGGVTSLRNDLINAVNKAKKSAAWKNIKYPKS